MEIKDYLKVLGKRAWLLVMIPAVAGVVAGLIAVQQPQAFRTSATLQLPRDEAATPALIAQKVADFRAAATNPTVENTVSTQTGVPVSKIHRLKIAQVGDSSQLTMSIVDKSKDPTDAKDVVKGVAQGALDYLQAPDVESGQKAVQEANDKIAAAQNDVAGASNDLQALYVKLNTSTPDDDIKTLRALITDAQSNLLKAQAIGDTVGQQTYSKAIDDYRVQLLALLSGSASVTLLQAKITDAQAALKTATDERDAATKQLDSAIVSADLTFSNEGQAIVRKTRVVKTAAAAVVAGFPIAIVLVLALDALGRRRRERPVGAGEMAGVGPPDDEHDEVETVSGPAVIAARVAPGREPAGSEPALRVANRTARESDALELEHNGHVAPAEPAVVLVPPRFQDGRVDAEDELDDETTDDMNTDELMGLPAAPDDSDDLDELDGDDEDESDAPIALAADESDAADETDADDAFAEELDDEDDLDGEDQLDGEDDLMDDELAEDADDELDDEDDVVSTNGWGRQPARVLGATTAFEEDDEGPEVDG